MYTSYLLLAIPLFILAAEFMSSGSIMDRLLRFCNALVGRFRGGLAQVNVVQSIIFASMSGSALADAAARQADADADDARRQVPASFAAALTAVSSVIGPIIPPRSAGALRAGLRHLHRLPVPRRRHPGLLHRRVADGA
jgi:TRAP-type C4-dicarboxylate transport system permease large subunit